MSETLSTNEAKHLLDFAKSEGCLMSSIGLLREKSLRVPTDVRSTPLEVALATDFHSLIEVLVRHEANRDLKNRALGRAVSLKRLDFIQLLVSHGAEISSVPFIGVLQIWEQTIIRYFLDHGADFIKDSPFAVAFGERIRTAIGPWKECREK